MSVPQENPGYLLHSEAELQSVAEMAVQHSLKLGADEASALASESVGTTIKVRNQRPASSVKDGMLSLGITVFDHGRKGFASTEALDGVSVRRTVAQACAIAREVDADPDGALASPLWLAIPPRDVPMFAPSGKTPAELSRDALEIETAARDMNAGKKVDLRVDEAAATSVDMCWARVMSNGFSGSVRASLQARACVAIASSEGNMARDWWNEMCRRERDLPSLEKIGSEAAHRALAKIGAHSLSTRTAPVLLDARVAAALVFDLVQALSGNVQQQKSGFLTGAIGKAVMADHIDLLEDPFAPYGLASSPWDSDGIAGTRRQIVEGGTVTGYFLSMRTARKLGLSPTGNADGPTNLTLQSHHGSAHEDTAAMLRKMQRGLWVTHIIGGQSNLATGDWSKAVEGFWVENGEVLHPVQDVTIAGNLSEMLRHIAAVGADSLCQGPVRTGSVLLESMRIAGQ